MARPREAVGCRTLICRKADSGQLNDLATIHLVVGKRCAVGGSISACFCERDLDTTISSTRPAVSILAYPVRVLRPASVFVCGSCVRKCFVFRRSSLNHRS